MIRTLHIIGAGLSGLSAAVYAVSQGVAVRLYEAAPHCGGRCRSFYDPHLGCVIDNGSHLLLSANKAVLSYAETIGSRDSFQTLPAEFPFVDVITGDRWGLRPNRGLLPWWLFASSRCPPPPWNGLRTFRESLRIAFAKEGTTVEECLLALSPSFWDPLTLAILNTPPHEASARLLGSVLRRTLARGASALAPLIARDGLSSALVEPALSWLSARDTVIRTCCPLQRIEGFGDNPSLRFRNETVVLRADEKIILAVSPRAAHRLLPHNIPSFETEAITNLHFRIEDKTNDLPLILGLIGGQAQWIVRRGACLSITMNGTPAFTPFQLWNEVSQILGMSGTPCPRYRVIVERSATVRQTPKQNARRPGTATASQKLCLAGDWTATGLPCTVESAILSGIAAVQLALVS